MVYYSSSKIEKFKNVRTSKNIFYISYGLLRCLLQYNFFCRLPFFMVTGYKFSASSGIWTWVQATWIWVRFDLKRLATTTGQYTSLLIVKLHLNNNNKSQIRATRLREINIYYYYYYYIPNAVAWYGDMRISPYQPKPDSV